LVRSPDKAAPLAERGVETVVGDITDPDAVEHALDGVGMVFHLAGRLLEPGHEPELYRTTHVDGTQLVLDVARTQPQLARFVHCSTTGVLGVTGAHPAAEDSPFAPTNLYEASKALAELRVRAAHRNGLPTVVIRPGLVYGPGDLHLVSFFRAVMKRQFRPIGREPVWMHPIYINDMTEAFVRCACAPEAVGELFHIAGTEPVPLLRLATVIAEAIGASPPTGHIPLAAARSVARFGDLLPERLRRSAPLTKSRLDFLTHSRVYSVAKAERVLGFVGRTTLEDGIARTVAWYQEHGYLPSVGGRPTPVEAPGGRTARSPTTMAAGS